MRVSRKIRLVALVFSVMRSGCLAAPATELQLANAAKNGDIPVVLELVAKNVDVNDRGG